MEAKAAGTGADGTTVQRARTFIVLMGVVALFGDVTYEGARGLVGPYLALLGASATSVGFAVGLGEFLGYGLRIVTGWLSDHTHKRWPLVIAGYSLNLLAVPGLAFVGRWEYAVLLVLLERIGKAVRSPARSTLVSYAACAAGEGKSFGLEEALDQIGAVSGPLLTALVIWLLREEPVTKQYQVAFFVLLLPVLANLALVVRARSRFPEPETFEPTESQGHPRLGVLFRWYVAASMLLALGFADWALLAFHALSAGTLDAGLIPVVYAGAMALDALGALAFGSLFDRFGVTVLAGTSAIAALFAPFVFLAESRASMWSVLLGAACWAVGMGAQDSIFKATIAKLVPKHERGRAYGVFFALFGLAWWLGSTTMGWLYERDRMLLVVFSVATQLLAAALFVVIGRRVPSAGATNGWSESSST